MGDHPVNRLVLILPALLLILSGCQAKLEKLDFEKFILEHKNESDLFLVKKSKYIKGVTNEQWGIIKKLGDPLNCEEKVKELDKITKGNLVTPKDLTLEHNAINYSLRQHNVTVLGSGTYILSRPITVPRGKTLIGRDGAIIDGSKIEISIYNKGSIKNIVVKNARKYGLVLGSKTVTYKVIIRYSGILPPSSSQGVGLESYGVISYDNCVVSVESSHGYNERGSSSVTEKGGNADGFAVKFGAHDITFIDTHAHHNSDDGFDFWKGGANAWRIKNNHISIRIFYSSANLNGKNPFTQNGDGNGFKFGSWDNYQSQKGVDRGTRFIYGSAACYNTARGFNRNKTSTKIIYDKLNAAGNVTDKYTSIFSTSPWSKSKEDDKFRLTCAMFPKD